MSGRVVITGGAELTPSSEFRALSRTPLNSLFDLGQWDHRGTGEGRGGVGRVGVSGVKSLIWTGLLVSVSYAALPTQGSTTKSGVAVRL